VKLIQISDTHIVPDGELVHGLDTGARLEACIAEINRHHDNASFCIVTGDLTDKGDAESYAGLRRRLAKLQLPYYLLIGNHDDRAVFRHCFPEIPCDPNGFVQSMLETDLGFCIFLDSNTPGERIGSFCEKRAAWLTERLAETGGNPAYLFLHHPPFEIGIPGLDEIRLIDPSHLMAALSGHENLRHLFLGHEHCPVSGSWRGLPYSAPRATAHQVATDENATKLQYLDAPGQYAVISIAANRTCVRLENAPSV
jgi:3',5'-cyclic AMP phosphodiesterase CpdA